MDKDTPINIDLRGNKHGFVRYKIYNDALKLPIGVKITSIYPTEISPKLEYLKAKKVKVLPTTIGNVSDDFKLEKIIVEPQEITISGPESTIDSINEVYTEAFPIDNLKESLTKDVSIDRERYKDKITHFSSGNFSLYININPIIIKKKFYDISITAFSPSKFQINPDKINIIVEGPKALIDNLSKQDIKASLDLTFNKQGTHMEEISVKLPDNKVKVITTEPKKISVWIY
jgi:YbbR domain-containing protein